MRPPAWLNEWLAWIVKTFVAALIGVTQAVANVLSESPFWLRHQATVLNERQRKLLKCLLDARPVGFEGRMNTRKYMDLTKTSRATPYRELADPVAKGYVRPTDMGERSSGYPYRALEHPEVAIILVRSGSCAIRFG